MFIVLKLAALQIMCFRLLFTAVGGDIIRISDDKETLVGGVVVLECSTALRTLKDAIEWHHNGVNEKDFMIIYKNGLIFNGFNGRANVNGTNGDYSLTINKVKLDDGGTYTCMENTGKKRKFELTVFAVIPSEETCISSIPKDDLGGFVTCDTESVTLTLSCSMSYRGNTDAVLEWKPSNTRIRRALAFVETKNDKNYITSNITVTMNQTTNYTYTCGVRYQKSSLISSYNWSSSSPFKVYSLSSLATKIEANCDQREIDCSVNYKRHKCRYTWASEKGKVLDREILDLTKLPSETYTCTANCTLHETQKCSFVAITTNYKKCDSAAIAIGVGASIAVAVVAIVVAFIIFIRRRCRKNCRRQQKKEGVLVAGGH